MLRLDSGVRLWYNLLILNKEMCNDCHITSSISCVHDNSKWGCRSNSRGILTFNQRLLKGILDVDSSIPFFV